MGQLCFSIYVALRQAYHLMSPAVGLPFTQDEEQRVLARPLEPICAQAGPCCTAGTLPHNETLHYFSMHFHSTLAVRLNLIACLLMPLPSCRHETESKSSSLQQGHPTVSGAFRRRASTGAPSRLGPKRHPQPAAPASSGNGPPGDFPLHQISPTTNKMLHSSASVASPCAQSWGPHIETP